jgi:hypothetical protein
MADPARLERLLDEMEITRVVNAVDFDVDRKDWAAVQRHFAEEIAVDFTSLVGGQPGRMRSADLVAAWRAALYADKLSHHMRTNHQVRIDGDMAEVLSQGYAWNRLRVGQGDDLWETWGTYRHTLVRTAAGWKVTGMAYFAHHSRGNEKVREYVPGAGA